MVDDVHGAKLTYTVAETAARLGIGRTLAWEMVRQGRFPVIWLGRRCLVPRAALEKFLAATKPAGTR